jgi:hypothetical protein
MKYGRSHQPYGILAPATRAALRFAARRNAPGRYDGWCPVSLFWRRQRKGPKGVRASRVTLVAGAVWLPQFHLHFVTRVHKHPWRGVLHGSLSVAAMYQGRVVMDYQRTIVQSSMVAAQPHRDQRPVHVFSLRQAHRGSGPSVQSAVSYTTSARRPVALPTTAWVTDRAQRLVRVFSRPNAPSDSVTSVQAMLSLAGRARRPIVLPITTWAADRADYPNLGQTHLGVCPGTGAPAQTLQTPRASKREPLAFRPRSKAIRNPVPPSSQASSTPQSYLHAQELVWRRAGPPAARNAGNEWQLDPHQIARQPHSRSLPGQEVASGPDHRFGRTPVAPALKLDAALMDRLADDVIRRMERRERIERARRGL